jgi:hypothetical protein
MTTVDPLYAQWLQSAALYTLREDADLVSRWGSTAQRAERITTIAQRADAEAEADRHLAFWAARWWSMSTRWWVSTRPISAGVITITIDQLAMTKAWMCL